MNKRVISIILGLLLLFSFPVSAAAADNIDTAASTAVPADEHKWPHDFDKLKEAPLTAQSEVMETTSTEGDWEYVIDDNGTPDTADDFAVILDYLGSDANVVTPVTLGGCPVTGISYMSGISTMTSLVISEGVKILYADCLSGCVALQSVTLPNSLQEIKFGCFAGSGLTSIHIPANVEKIGEWAIDYCPDMQAITVDPANSWFKSVDGVLFDKAGTTLMMYPKGSHQKTYSVPEGVQTIRTDAFYAAHMTQVTLPQSLTCIEFYAFDSNDFESFIIPANVQKIGQLAFINNQKLKEFIVFNDTVTYDYDESYPDANGYVLDDPATVDVVMYGHEGSATQTYAKTYHYSFSPLPSAVTLNTASASMLVSDTGTLSAATTPSGLGIIWSSDNPSIVSVDASGNIKANASGTATITATSFDKSASCVVTVNALTPVGLSCTKADATIYGAANGSVTVTASGGNSGSYEYSINEGASWQSAGTFGGLAAGSYTAAVRDARYPTNTATQVVAVGQPAYMGAVAAKKIPSKVNAGNALTITPPAAPKGYTVQSISYSSSNPAVATVDASGTVTFLAGGKVTIITKVVSTTVDKKGRIKTKTTTVKKTITVKQPVAAISLNLGSTTIARTQKVRLIPSIAPATASSKKVKWTTSNKKVATVSSSGVVVGKAGGTAVITCTAADGSRVIASCTVTVTPIYPTGVKISKSALTVKAGKSASLKATVAPKNTDYKAVTWASSDAAVATVDAKGKIKGMAPGTAVITVTTSQGQTASCTVTVK